MGLVFCCCFTLLMPLDVDHRYCHHSSCGKRQCQFGGTVVREIIFSLYVSVATTAFAFAAIASAAAAAPDVAATASVAEATKQRKLSVVFESQHWRASRHNLENRK